MQSTSEAQANGRQIHTMMYLLDDPSGWNQATSLDAPFLAYNEGSLMVGRYILSGSSRLQ